MTSNYEQGKNNNSVCDWYLLPIYAESPILKIYIYVYIISIVNRSLYPIFQRLWKYKMNKQANNACLFILEVIHINVQ